MSIAFAFVCSPLDVTAPLPYDLTPGLRIRRADGPELERIRRHLSNFDGSGFSWHSAFEHEWRSGGNDVVRVTHSTSPVMLATTVALPPERLRYIVIERTRPPANPGCDDLEDLRSLERASRLARCEFCLPALFFADEGVKTDKRMMARMGLISCFQIDKVHEADLREITLCYELLTGFGAGPERDEIRRCLGLFWALDSIDRDHPLFTMGLFTVLESLLTHNPETDHDGLAHQISTKVPLLDARMPSRIDYSPFKDVQPIRVWKSLYAYRSKIAHGGDTSRELKTLKHPETVRAFMLVAVKKLLKLALAEPRLVVDLKAV